MGNNGGQSGKSRSVLDIDVSVQSAGSGLLAGCGKRVTRLLVLFIDCIMGSKKVGRQ